MVSTTDKHLEELSQPLDPRPKMGANERCWCRSGIKYKNCHRDRHREIPLETHQLRKIFQNSMERGRCSYPSGCNERIIFSHTIQRRGGILAIQENGHVYDIIGIQNDFDGGSVVVSPKKIGNRRASTFPGFCSNHDDGMFKVIESKTLSIEKETAFLFSFRAASFELHRKLFAIDVSEKIRILDRGYLFEQQADFQQRRNYDQYWNYIALRDLEFYKDGYDKMYINNDYSNFRYYSIVLDNLLPIVTCGGFAPEYDFQGKLLQDLQNPSMGEHITLNITGIGGRSMAVFGWFGKDNGPSERLVQSFKLIPDEKKPEALIRLAFEYLENVFMRISWWDALSQKYRRAVDRHRASGISGMVRAPKSLFRKGVEWPVSL